MKQLMLMLGISTLLTACNYSSTQCGNTKIIDQSGLDESFINHVCKQTTRANGYLGIDKPYTITLVNNNDGLLNSGYERLAYATDDAIRVGVYPDFDDAVLFHEIRHIWQFSRGAKAFTTASYSTWSRDPDEKDANRFGRKAVALWGSW